MNPYYTHTSAAPAAQSRALSVIMRNEFDTVASGFDAVLADINLRLGNSASAPVFAGPVTFNGTASFNSTVSFASTATGQTPSPGDTSTKLATTNFVANALAAGATIYDLVDVAINTSNTAGAPSTIRTREHVDTSGGAITRFLPLNAPQWQMIQFVDAKRTWPTNNFTLYPQATESIENGAPGEPLVCTNFTDQPLLQRDNNGVWRIIG